MVSYTRSTQDNTGLFIQFLVGYVAARVPSQEMVVLLDGRIDCSERYFGNLSRSRRIKPVFTAAVTVVTLQA